MKKTQRTALGILLFSAFFSTSLLAQNTIQDQYRELYEKSSTWEDYKVIKLDKLSDFWAVMTDSLDQKRQKMNEANSEIASLTAKLAATENQLAETTATLEASEALNDSISFLGLQLSKITYNIILWSLIFLLAAGISGLYVLFQRSNNVTRKTRKEYAHLELELKRQKDKYREMQIKLKRELQTALNSLSELRV